MIKAITFDLWNTILRDTPDFDEVRKEARMIDFDRILRSHGHNLDLFALYTAYDKSRVRIEDVWSTNAEVVTREQIQMILELAKEGFSRNLDDKVFLELEAAYGGALFKNPPALDDEIAGILKTCRKKELRIGLICNTGRSSGKFLTMALERLDIADLFDAMTYSDEIGIRKPDPKIFQATLEKLGSTPDKTVHVGDELSADVLGAKNAGLSTVWLNRNKEHIKEGVPKPEYEIDDLKGLLGILDKMQSPSRK
jgi:FMN phosphatase YigB (HAD superfamily)